MIKHLVNVYCYFDYILGRKIDSNLFKPEKIRKYGEEKKKI